ncbi:MAG: hypothetical protein AB7H48_01050 [Parachlamydiales bacterium]
MKKKNLILWVLFSIVIVISSCSQKKDLEKIRWEEFYTRLLFIECAAFTLYGSKPMTELILDHRSKEEKESSRLETSESAAKISWNPLFDFEETWRLWEKDLSKEKINNYIITHFPIKRSEYDFVYIVNILELSTVIKKHYDLFQKYIGFDFDPLEVVLDIQNKDSLFWNKIFNGEPTTPEKICLLGILYGYGIENSYPFSLLFNKERAGSSKKFTSHLHKQLSENLETKNIKEFSSTKFLIPGFRTFSTYSPTKLKYEKEKTEIIKYYQGKDLEQATFDLLYK